MAEWRDWHHFGGTIAALTMSAWRLRSLSLEGFKSFASRVELSFPGAITAIVGPNGTGKSNLADAIAWVLGEQSARLLRSQSMADVIFAGAPARAPLGAAQVVLVLQEGAAPGDNGDGLEVSRRVFRDGASEYRLGGRRVRLKDIQDHLMDAGLGTRAYAIIEQGRIGQVLSQRSTDRRALFEEAAGISKFRARRHEAELKLAETRANLLRVVDIATEVRRSLDGARRQARRAERHRELRRQLLEVRSSLLAFRRQRVLADLDVRRNELVATETAEAEAAAELGRVEVELAGRRGELDGLRESLATARGEEARCDASAQRREAEEAAARREREDAESRRQAASEGAARLVSQQRSQAGRQAELEAAVSAAEGVLAEAEAAARNAAAAADRAEGAAQAADGELDGARRALLAAVADATDARNRSHRLEVEVEQAGHQRNRLGAEEERLRTHLAGVAQAENEAVAREAAATAALRAAETEREAVRSSRDESAGKAVELAARRDQAGHERWQAHHEREALARALASSRALPQALARALPEDSVLGTVADFLDPPAELLGLVDRAYRDLLNLPVLASEAAFDKLLASRRQVDGTLQAVVAGECDEQRPSPLLEQAGVEPRHLAWLRAALPRVAVAASIDEARALATADPELVVLLPGGARRRGRWVEVPGRQAAIPGTLELRRRERELGAAEETARAREDALAGEIEVVQESLAALVGRLGEGDAAVGAAAASLASAGSSREALHREHGRLERELEALAEESVRLERETTALGERLAAAGSEANRLAERAAELETSLDRLGRTSASAREAASRTRAQAERAAGAAEVARERARSAGRELERHLEEGRALAHQLAETRAQEAEQKERGERAAAAAAVARAELQELLAGRAAARREAERLAERESALKDEVARVAGAAEERRAAHLAARDAAHAARLSLSEANAALARLEETASLTLGDEAEIPEQPPDAEEIAALEQRETALAADIEGMGPVNELAVVERDELEQRHRFLHDQRRDLERSLASLGETVNELDAVCAARFQSTLEEASAVFGEVFRNLFGGGDAHVELSDPESPLDTGIEIRVRPPGKHAQSVLLLSGGEKALAAVALLLALFRIRPAPFCVLDEVDAPLDDVNVERLCRLLREMSSGTQFLLITHNRRTMAHADILYGVTMEEPGVSTMVSVRLEE
jgi:chromosome segregation protein